MKASYVATDRQLAAVRSQSAWPSPRPGNPAQLAIPDNPAHLASVEAFSVEAFSVALRVVRNRTLTTEREPEANITLSSLFTFYVDVNEFLLLSVAKAIQVLASCITRSCL